VKSGRSGKKGGLRKDSSASELEEYKNKLSSPSKQA
jgi:hypothetical protein